MHRSINDPKHIGRTYQIPCSDCDNKTRHQVLACVSESGYHEEIGSWTQDYEIIMCLGCECISFRKDWQSADEMEQDEEGKLVSTSHPEIFPQRIQGRKRLKEDHYLPHQIREIYHEVHQAIHNGQKILAGIGIRAIVEAVCAEKKANGKSLFERIDDLATQNVLTTEGAQILHGTRLLGNEAAHEVRAPKDRQLMAALEVAEQLLRNVFILPQIAEDLPKAEAKGRAAKSDPTRVGPD